MSNRKSKKSNQTYYEAVQIPLHTFDIEKLVILEPAVFEYDNISNTKSLILYKNTDDKLCIPYIEGPKQRVYFSEAHELVKAADKKNKDDVGPLNGYQVTYPMNSIYTIDDPTEDEIYFRNTLNAIRDKLTELMPQFIELTDKDDLPILPEHTITSYRGCRVPGAWLKPCWQYPKQKDSKALDKTKSERFYVKFLSFGKEENLKVTSTIYGPGDEIIHPSTLVGESGDIEPFFKVPSVFYGAHGGTGAGASIQIKLDQCNYYPVKKKVTQRFTRPNTCTDSLSFLKDPAKSKPEEEENDDTIPLSLNTTEVTEDNDETNKKSLEILEEEIKKPATIVKKKIIPRKKVVKKNDD